MHLPSASKTLLNLLSDGQFHSGTELATKLNISRSAVWKHMNGLSELGLPYAAVSGKGYRLERTLELLDKTKILKTLDKSAQSLIRTIYLFDQIPSTNSYLVERGLENADSGSICLAEQQTAGKGRRGRHWVSPYGSNIYLSLLWRFQSSPLAISGLSLVIGIAIIRALTKHYDQPFQLKWPNDIYCHNKKLGGILVEVSGESEGPCAAVIGIGLNIHLTEAEATDITQDWTDLTKITGLHEHSRNALIAGLLNQLVPILADYEETSIGIYLAEWRQYDCLKDKPATLYVGQQNYTGIVKGIDDKGFLLLSLPNGKTQAFASGEVSFNKANL